MPDGCGLWPSCFIACTSRIVESKPHGNRNQLRPSYNHNSTSSCSFNFILAKHIPKLAFHFTLVLVPLDARSAINSDQVQGSSCWRECCSPEVVIQNDTLTSAGWNRWCCVCKTCRSLRVLDSKKSRSLFNDGLEHNGILTTIASVHSYWIQFIRLLPRMPCLMRYQKGKQIYEVDALSLEHAFLFELTQQPYDCSSSSHHDFSIIKVSRLRRASCFGKLFGFLSSSHVYQLILPNQHILSLAGCYWLS